MASLLYQRLELIHRWYSGMVHPVTGMLEYKYLPQTNTYIRCKCSIDQIAGIWNMEVLDRFLKRQELSPIIEKSLAHYETYLSERDGYLIFDSSRSGEPSSIAHSAFMMLALLNSPPPRRLQLIAALADGILQQQRPDGSYKIYFDNPSNESEGLYAGEAMLALIHAYSEYPDIRYLPSVERAIVYYDDQFFRRGAVAGDALIFFANWQSQTCRGLFECASSNAVKEKAADYAFQLHAQIIADGFYTDLSAQRQTRQSVEVASALEGLNDAYAITRDSGDEHADLFKESICLGLDYLIQLQYTRKLPDKALGGFGVSPNDRSQRSDVIGHAASAFIKTIENAL